MSFEAWTSPLDPDERLDFGINWLPRLNGDTIVTSTWVIPSGVTKVTESFTTTLTTIWLTGGVAGTTYELTNRVTTAGGRTMDKTMRLKVADK